MMNIKTILITLLLFCFYLNYISGQSKDIEQLKADFNTIVFENLDSAKVIALKMLELTKSNTERPYALAQHTMGNYHLFASQYAEALSFYRKALVTYKKVDNYKDASGILINMASCEAEMGFLDEAMAYHDQSLRIQDSLNINGIARATNELNLGILHFELKNYDKAIEQYRGAKSNFLEIKDTFSVAECDYNLALLLSDIDSMDAAMVILRQLEDYHGKNNHVYKLNQVLLEIGRNYRILGDYDKSQSYLDRGLELAQQNEDGSMLSLAYNKLFDLAIDKNKLTQAERYTRISYEAALRNQDRYDQIIDLKNLSKINELTGDYKEALKYHKMYFELNDSIVGEKQLNKIADLASKYELDKKEKAIELLREKERRSKFERNALILLVMGLLFLAVLITIVLYLRIRTQKLLKQNAEQALKHSEEKAIQQEKELTAYALQLASKNQFLENIKQNVSELDSNNTRQVQSIVNTIHINQVDNESWEEFKERFRSVHKHFERDVKQKYPTLSSGEMRLMILLRMSLNSREIAHILNISMDGIKKARYRLRKKLQLTTNDSLEELVLSM